MTPIKYDNGKPPMSLIPHEALTAEAEVLAYGARKYSAHNWRYGFAWSRLMDATLRHLAAFGSGEDKDPESGLSHLAHARATLGFLIAHEVSGLGHDDRYSPEKTSSEEPGEYVDILDESGACSGWGTWKPVTLKDIIESEGPR